MTTTIPSVDELKRIVVKVGSALLLDVSGRSIRRAWLASLVADLAALQSAGHDVLIVTSGAIALGRTIIEPQDDSVKLEASQAAASIGQIALSSAWSDMLSQRGIVAGQILLTLGDTEERERYLNARSTIQKLLEWRSIPIINENDTVATTEIKYGDNDRLAARVSGMIGADLLVLLSDVDGLYDRPPILDPEARHIPVVEKITRDIEQMAGTRGSPYARGGMATKIEAAKIATEAGTHMIIGSGRDEYPIEAIRKGARCTWFLASETPRAAFKRWIGGALEIGGTLVVDQGAINALRKGKSLLPAGVVAVKGEFESGAFVLVRGPDGREVARGIVQYSSEEVNKILGKSSSEICKILEGPVRTELIHRDMLAMRND